MTAVDSDEAWQDLNASGGSSSRPAAWKKWAAVAAVTVGAATIATTTGLTPVPDTVPSAGAAAFTMTSLIGPQDNVECGSTSYPAGSVGSGGWTIVTTATAGGDLDQILEAGTVVKGQKFCFDSGTYKLDQPIRLKDNMQVVGEKGTIFDAGYTVGSFSVDGSLWKADITALNLTKRTNLTSLVPNRCSGVHASTPERGPNSLWPWEPNCIDQFDVWWGGRWVEPEEGKSTNCPSPLPPEDDANDDRFKYGNAAARTCVGLDSHDKNAYSSGTADPYEAYVAINESGSNDYLYLNFDPGATPVVISRPLTAGITDRDGGDIHYGWANDASPPVVVDHADNVTFRNIVIQHVGTKEQDGALDVQNGGWTIRNVETRYNHGIGLAAYGSMVEYNLSHHNGQLNFGAKGSGTAPQVWNGSTASTTRSEWNFNEAHTVNLARYWVGWEGGLTKYSKTTNQVFSYNYMHDGPQAGVWFDINNRGGDGNAWNPVTSTRNRVTNNWISNQGTYVDQTQDYPLNGSQSVGRGIFMEIGCQAYVADNLIVRVGIGANGFALERGPSGNPGIWITESHSTIVERNVVDSSAQGIIVTDKGRDDQNGPCSTRNLSNQWDQGPNPATSTSRIHMPFDNAVRNNKMRMTIGMNDGNLRPVTGLDSNTGITYCSKASASSTNATCTLQNGSVLNEGDINWYKSSHTGKWTPGFGSAANCSGRTLLQFDLAGDCDRWMEAYEPTPESGALFPDTTSTSQVSRSPNIWRGNQYYVPSSKAGAGLFRWQKFFDGSNPYNGSVAIASITWNQWTAAYNNGGWVYAAQDQTYTPPSGPPVPSSFTTQSGEAADPACSLRTPGEFEPTKYTFSPTAGTDIWVQIDAPDFYKDRFWYVPYEGCAEVKQANSSAATWVKVQDEVAGSFSLSRWDNDVEVLQVVSVPGNCGATTDPTSCSPTTLTGTGGYDTHGYDVLGMPT